MVKTLVGDALLFVAGIIGIPVAILILGTPIVLFVRLLINLGGRLL